jgi:hypothetical protein
MVATQIVQKNGGSGSAPKIGMYNALDRACGVEFCISLKSHLDLECSDWCVFENAIR